MSPEARAAYQREWRAQHPERVRAYARDWARKRRADPSYRAVERKRSRAWKRSNPGKVYAGKRVAALRRYGLSPAEYQRLCRQQRNRCAICERRETRKGPTGRVRPLSVDHDHGTGKVRGLLCNDCNRGLGLLGDRLVRLKAAVRYLEGA